MDNDRMLDRLHERWLEPPDYTEVEEVSSLKMTIEIDFSYDGEMTDMEEVETYLEAMLESGAESTCSDVRLIKVVKYETI